MISIKLVDPRYIGGSGGMAKSSIPLPEICVEDFEHSWTKFRLAVAANKWEREKELAVLPALLRGKLVEYYVSLEDDEKTVPDTLRKALMDRAGISKDPLVSAKVFSERRQGAQETVKDFEGALKKLFKEAYPEETVSTSGVLRQRFLAGLRSDIAKHILLKGNPTTLDEAVKDAVSIERALAFEDGQRIAPVQAVKAKTPSEHPGGNEELQKTLDQVLKRLEGLEARFREKQGSTGNDTRPHRRCYRCGKEGLVEPNYKGQGRLLVARSLNTVNPRNEVSMQVINTGHETMTLYSGTTIASFNSSVEIMPVSDSEHTPDNVQGDAMPEVDLARTDLSTPQRHDLNRLILEFGICLCQKEGAQGGLQSSSILSALRGLQSDNHAEGFHSCFRVLLRQRSRRCFSKG